MSVPAYPSFRPLELADKPLFDGLFRASPPEISEYTFTNLYAWRRVYNFQICRLADFIILRLERSGQQFFFDPIGTGSGPAEAKKEAISKIATDSAAGFVRLPEATAALFQRESVWSVIPDPDNSDYLFETKQLIELKGKKYDGKRNLIRNFSSHYPHEFAPLGQAHVGESLGFAAAWCAVKGCDKVPGLRDERVAFVEMLYNLSSFNIIAAAIRVEGQIAAIGLAEPLNPDTLVMHALKARSDMPGLYQTMVREFLAHAGSGYAYLNMEQDLGVAGLRTAKRSYHPVRMVRKYAVRRKGS